MRKIFALALFALFPTFAAAHEMAKGPNGGQVVDVASHHVELVLSAQEMILFLTDEKDAPVASQGTKNARAIVQDGGRTATVPLEPRAPNKFGAQLAQPVNAGARIAFSVTLSDGRIVQARFVAK